MADPVYGSLPFAEQVQFLLAKRLVPTGHWTDLWQVANDTGFMVAKASAADLLGDLHGAVLQLADEGQTLAWFRQEFERIVAAHGWTGWTGEDTPARRAWRANVIADTNLTQSYKAARWQQIDAVRDSRPYVQRRHADGVLNPRPEHLEWDGIVLRSDDPWVQEHPGAEGWGCHCKWFALTPEDLARLGKDAPDPSPPQTYYDWRNPRTGETVQVPTGVDPGFAYRPGATRDLAAELRERAGKYPGQLAADLNAEADRLAADSGAQG